MTGYTSWLTTNTMTRYGYTYDPLQVRNLKFNNYIAVHIMQYLIPAALNIA